MPKTDTPFGFGSCVKRFKYVGVHPKLTALDGNHTLGPGHYNPKSPECSSKNKAASWKVKLESEEFSKFLGFRNPQVLCDRLFERTLGGPGTHDLFDRERKAGAWSFGRERRFHCAARDRTLPPGTYTLKSPTTKFTKTPTFEWDGFASRFKSGDPPYRLAPNRYALPHPCISDRVVSKRGPYDTFTGPRDETTIKNYFAPAWFKPPDTFHVVPSALDHLLHHPGKRRCGKFLVEERFPEGVTVIATKNGFSMYQRDEEFPGPAAYNASVGIKQSQRTKYPFNSSNRNARPPPNWKIHPGPDRYKVKYPRCNKKASNESWMFLSTANRDLIKVESYSNFIY